MVFVIWIESNIPPNVPAIENVKNYVHATVTEIYIYVYISNILPTLLFISFASQPFQSKSLQSLFNNHAQGILIVIVFCISSLSAELFSLYFKIG